MTDGENAIVAELHEIKSLLHGKNGKLGIVAKVHIIWSSWVWLLCCLSACLASVATYLIKI